MSKKALGKGIGALLGDLQDTVGESIVQVPVEALGLNTLQPRRGFREDTLGELAQSIREKGVLQPILAEKEGDQYTIVAGERRYRAAKIAGLKEIPVLVRKFQPHERLEIALVENLQREDLTPVEEANAYKQLMELAHLRQEDVGARVGKSRSAVANCLRLLQLPPDILEALDRNEISAGHARAILSVVNPSGRTLLYRKIVSEDLSVRQAERYAQKLNRGTGSVPKGTEPQKKSPSPELLDIEERLMEALGTKVKLKGTAEKGQIQVSYFSQDDLQRLLEHFGLA